MGISLSGGPWQYNRFDQIDEASKPDYLDFDKDGDKKEPMKKALKEKGKKPVNEKKELPDFIKKKMDEKKGKECTCKEWVEELVADGHDLSEYTWDDMVEIFNEGMKYGKKPTDKEKEAKKDMKEEVCHYLMNEGFANNPVSAEIMFNHMSEEWLEAIKESGDQ